MEMVQTGGEGIGKVFKAGEMAGNAASSAAMAGKERNTNIF